MINANSYSSNPHGKTFASLFTGGGLADIGAQQAGYDLLWGVEFDAEIAAIANKNLAHRDTVHAASVIGFDWHSVEAPDHLHMSPPCQDFSVAKKSGAVANPNDELADACIEALTILQPQTVTLENVEAYRKAPGFQRIVDHLWGAGYWVNVDVLNAADFGVPQTRRRLFLRAVKGAIPSPLPAPVRPWAGWYDAIADLIPELPETEFAEWQLKRLPKALTDTCFVATNRTATRRAAKEPSTTIVCVGGGHSVATQAFLVGDKGSESPAISSRSGKAPSFSVVKGNGSGGLKACLVDGLANNNGATVTAVAEADPSFTVKASTSKQASRAMASGRVVRMTPRCLARFQTVPDWYKLPSKNTLACKIIGNGIPCLMMQRIMESFV